MPPPFETYTGLLALIRHIGVTTECRKMVDYFHVLGNELPAGLRVELRLGPERSLRAHLARNISECEREILDEACHFREMLSRGKRSVSAGSEVNGGEHCELKGGSFGGWKRWARCRQA